MGGLLPVELPGRDPVVQLVLLHDSDDGWQLDLVRLPVVAVVSDLHLARPGGGGRGGTFQLRRLSSDMIAGDALRPTAREDPVVAFERVDLIRDLE